MELVAACPHVPGGICGAHPPQGPNVGGGLETCLDAFKVLGAPLT